MRESIEREIKSALDAPDLLVVSQSRRQSKMTPGWSREERIDRAKRDFINFICKLTSVVDDEMKI